ncbi:DUF1501 domain-containing protein [Dactylosporangium sp. NPDC051541]|uniref:DUF1501 domain-containing protein n=1 Tax=Dactylosporangium sp. NPDC051541 TaxID=3363977 RepID=UPI0037B172D1
MDLLTRRKFLMASGVAGAVAAGAGAVTWKTLMKSAPADGHVAGAKTPKLVLLTLYGGNDGLNTLVPYSDPLYHSLRPGLAYAPEQVLKLDDEFGFNPVLKGMQRLWKDQQLTVVRGVGYPHPDRSHFRSMDIWQTASPTHPIDTGWVGRWMDANEAPAEAAVSFESVLPPLLAGRTRSGACMGIGGLQLPDGITTEMVSAFSRDRRDDTAMRARAANVYADLIRVDELVRAAEKTVPFDPDASKDSSATGTGGANALAAQLALVARCIESNVPTQVYSVSLGGFDTHAGERPGHELLLGQLDSALTNFVTRMAKTENGRLVTVVVYSEFGRRVRGNASEGTDHGTAGPVFVAGSRVAGGFLGEQPSLKDLDDGDLKATVDFRDIFGSLLASVLDAEPAKFLEGYEAKLLPLLRPE